MSEIFQLTDKLYKRKKLLKHPKHSILAVYLFHSQIS